MLFGISPIGWVHTLGSLPAVPAAAYMFARSGRIVPRSASGAVYFFSMLIGAVTIFFIAHESVSYVIAAGTLLLLLVGYGAARVPQLGRAARYIEAISLTLSTFLLLVPSIKETLTRVPDGHPLVTDPRSPVLVGALGTVFVLTIIALIAQIIHLRKEGGLSPARRAAANG
jgi:hypothetical protein